VFRRGPAPLFLARLWAVPARPPESFGRRGAGLPGPVPPEPVEYPAALRPVPGRAGTARPPAAPAGPARLPDAGEPDRISPRPGVPGGPAAPAADPPGQQAAPLERPGPRAAHPAPG